jgi:hypothetical protein
VADIFHRHGPAYLRDHILTPAQGKVLRAVIACRTAELGGHLIACLDCGHVHPSYNSCRDRHCPTCQSSQAKSWLDRRLELLLPIPYFHVVFTLPEPLRAVALANPTLVYDLLFASAADSLQELAATRLGAQLGITAVLHTWTRDMRLHPHLHCVVTGGGLARDGSRWVASSGKFLFPVAVIGALFRGKFLDGISRAHRASQIRFAGTSAHLADPVAFACLRDQLYKTRWVVYAKRPFAGPLQILTYLARYTHRIAISDSRLRAVREDRIVFKTRGLRSCTLRPDEFIRRFLLHVLPPEFRKIRHYGLLAPANIRSRLATARRRLAAIGRTYVTRPFQSGEILGEPISKCLRCPICGSENLTLELLTPAARGPPSSP